MPESNYNLAQTFGMRECHLLKGFWNLLLVGFYLLESSLLFFLKVEKNWSQIKRHL